MFYLLFFFVCVAKGLSPSKLIEDWKCSKVMHVCHCSKCANGIGSHKMSLILWHSPQLAQAHRDHCSSGSHSEGKSAHKSKWNSFLFWIWAMDQHTILSMMLYSLMQFLHSKNKSTASKLQINRGKKMPLIYWRPNWQFVDAFYY